MTTTQPELRACRTKDEAGTPLYDPDLWFPVSNIGVASLSDIQLTKRVCGMCSVQAECLQEAFDLDARHGTWGGFTEWERSRMRRTAGANATVAQVG